MRALEEISEYGVRFIEIPFHVKCTTSIEPDRERQEIQRAMCKMSREKRRQAKHVR